MNARDLSYVISLACGIVIFGWLLVCALFIAFR